MVLTSDGSKRNGRRERESLHDKMYLILGLYDSELKTLVSELQIEK